MSWLAILLALASLGGSPAPPAKHKQRCTAAAAEKHKCKPAPRKKTKPKPRKQPAPGATRPAPGSGDAPQRSDPDSTPAPAATPTPAATATATPTPTPVYPRRTAVDLLEWDIQSSYPALAAGRVTFNARNLGEDDHNLSVRGGGREYGGIDLAPRESGSLSLDLTPGTYTLYCPLLGHEDAGMRTDITVR